MGHLQYTISTKQMQETGIFLKHGGRRLELHIGVAELRQYVEREYSLVRAQRRNAAESWLVPS
uniref:Uncharacterized protein n=1 Tax=Nymphaea colorata TaxID=210225 RepID=A0A5K0ZT23_9MAGN